MDLVSLVLNCPSINWFLNLNFFSYFFASLLSLNLFLSWLLWSFFFRLFLLNINRDIFVKVLLTWALFLSLLNHFFHIRELYILQMLKEWLQRLFIDTAENSLNSLFRVLNLQEWVRVFFSSFTFLTEVKVFTDWALVSHSNDWFGFTTITNVFVMDNLIFTHLFFWVV